VPGIVARYDERMSLCRRIFALLPALLLAGSAVALAGVPDTADAARFPAYHKLGPDLAGSGQPTAEGLAELEALGFRTVVNLRTEGEGAAAERAAVEGQGLRYVSVPISRETFSLGDVAAVRKVLDEPGVGPVLLHCATANRVGAVWAVIQAQDGRSLEQAEAAGRAAGLHSAVWIEAVHRLLATPATAP